MRLLFAGETIGGSANYYMGVLNFLKARVTHVPSSKILTPSAVSAAHDAFILSDFSRKNMTAAAEKKIAERVARGAGLMMIGGWGSFSGPFGQWRGSRIEKLLPVRCAKGDDRVNFPQGAYPVLRRNHAIVRGLSWKRPPMFCGLNRLSARPRSVTVLEALPVLARAQPALRLQSARSVPFLVVNADPTIRTAALATDLAPHWCGGLVDWGPKRMKLRVNDRVQVEVGSDYVRFISGMARWLAGTI